MAVVDELVTILGVDVARNAKEKLESFKNGIDSVKNTLLGLSVVITGAAATMGFMVKGAADEAAELQKLSDKTGVSTDALQEWGYAATKVGGDSKALHGDLQALQEKFMGTGKDAEKTLLSLADRMKGMSGSQAQNLGKGWGLSDDTIALLRKGRDGIEDLRKEAHKLGGVIPADSIKRASDFKKQLAELQFAFHGLTSQVAIAMIPALSRAVEIFKGWMESNREWISLGLEALMTGIVSGFERFWNILKKFTGVFDPILDAIRPFFDGLEAGEVVMHLVTGALAGLLVLFSPMIANFIFWGAVVAAAAAVLEDLFYSVTQGKGYFADLFAAFEQRWPALADAIKKIGAFFKEFIIDIIKTIPEIAKTVFDGAVKIVTGFIDVLESIVNFDFGKWAEESKEKIMRAWESIKQFFKDLWKEVKGYIPEIPDIGAIAGKAAGSVTNALGTAAEWLGFGGDDKKKGAPAPSTIPVGGQPAAVRLPSPRGAQGTQYTDNRTQNFNVATTDPQQAAEAAAALSSGQPVGTPGVAAPAM